MAYDCVFKMLTPLYCHGLVYYFIRSFFVVRRPVSCKYYLPTCIYTLVCTFYLPPSLQLLAKRLGAATATATNRPRTTKVGKHLCIMLLYVYIHCRYRYSLLQMLIDVPQAFAALFIGWSNESFLYCRLNTTYKKFLSANRVKAMRR